MSILANIRNATLTIWDGYEKECFEKGVDAFVHINHCFAVFGK
jgi:hypothetical protein